MFPQAVDPFPYYHRITKVLKKAYKFAESLVFTSLFGAEGVGKFLGNVKGRVQKKKVGIFK